MKLALNAAEDAALHKLVAGGDGDVIIRLDREGLIEDASSHLDALEFLPSELLLKPHIADLAQRDYQDDVRAFVGQVLSRRDASNRVEFPAVARLPKSIESRRPSQTVHWHSLSLYPVVGDSGQLTGAIGLLRSVDRLRSLESELNASATQDGVTGLANHRSFAAILERFVRGGQDGTVILCEIEHFRALQSRYGHAAGEDMLWAFAQFLTSMAHDEFTVGRIDGERFAALLPAFTESAAIDWAWDVRSTFAGLTLPLGDPGLDLSVSIGVAPADGSVDEVMRRAELALVMARASGRVERFSHLYGSVPDSSRV